MRPGTDDAVSRDAARNPGPGSLPLSVVDPKGGPTGGKNVLIVSTVEHASATLSRYVGDADTIKVVVPVVRQGVLDWLANDERAFTRAEEVADRTAEELPGETVDSRAGEADVGLAIRDALASFPAAEIVVALSADADMGFIESASTKDIGGQRSINGVPVRCVVIPDDGV